MVGAVERIGSIVHDLAVRTARDSIDAVSDRIEQRAKQKLDEWTAYAADLLGRNLPSRSTIAGAMIAAAMVLGRPKE